MQLSWNELKAQSGTQNSTVLKTPSISPFTHCASYLESLLWTIWSWEAHLAERGESPGRGAGPGRPAPAAKAPVAISRGEWGSRDCRPRGARVVLILRAREDAKRCETRSERAGRALPVAPLGCWDLARLPTTRQETSNKILYLIFSNETQQSPEAIIHSY